MISGAISDLAGGFRHRRVWLALAREDIGDQHKRTALGPMWLLLNYLAFAGTFIFVFDRGHGTENYAPYVAVGLFVWFYIMEIITNSVSLFSREESFIKGTTLPLSVYVMRLATQSLIRAGYALIGCAGILALSGIAITPQWGWAGLGILIILLVTPAAIILFAFIGALFPDSQFMTSNVMRVGMFLTPVFWIYLPGNDGTRGVRAIFYYYNPFTYFLEIVRVPILLGEVPARSYMLCAAIGLGIWAVALLLLERYRKRIVFLL